MDVGTRIREHREAAGLRQDQLAEICGVSRQTISNWERNLGAWLVTLVPYIRLIRRHRFVYNGEIGRYLDKSLVLEESRATKIARSMLRHIQIWNGVLLTLATLAGLAAGGVLTPGMAACIVAVDAALVALGVHLDKERQRNGGPVNPPLPPQR